jgi:RimJ/RimL family protein N-acetyltransferase
VPVLHQRPTLTTARLVLRPFVLRDAPRVRELAGERDVAATALNIPHPFERGVAEQWIASHHPQWQEGTGVTFAIVRQEDRRLAGALGLTIERRHAAAELGYWIGKPHWGLGYASEAVAAVVGWAFADLGLNRLHASHFAGNLASRRVLEKAGFLPEGVAREAVFHWGRFEDLVRWGLLRGDPRP